jgi:hypothetical protein
MTAAPPGINLAGNRRRWRDVSALRVTIALLVAPILSLALLMGIAELIVIGFFPGENWNFVISDFELCAMMVAYWMLAGWGYLVLIPRWRGFVSRVECLLSGAALTLIAPPLLALPWEIISSAPGAKADLVIENALYALRTQPGWAAAYWLGFSLVFLPFGVFSGWLLWRIGVRPATARLSDAATVFE